VIPLLRCRTLISIEKRLIVVHATSAAVAAGIVAVAIASGPMLLKPYHTNPYLPPRTIRRVSLWQGLPYLHPGGDFVKSPKQAA
jgi:hypothetical protein